MIVIVPDIHRNYSWVQHQLQHERNMKAIYEEIQNTPEQKEEYSTRKDHANDPNIDRDTNHNSNNSNNNNSISNMNSEFNIWLAMHPPARLFDDVVATLSYCKETFLPDRKGSELSVGLAGVGIGAGLALEVRTVSKYSNMTFSK